MLELQETTPKLYRYKCANCGNTCLQEYKPDNTVCGGCNSPDWKLMIYQQSYRVDDKDYYNINGEI